LIEEFVFIYKDECDFAIDEISKLNSNGVSIRYEPELPKDWKKMIPEERQEYSSGNSFHLKVKSAYFQFGVEASKSDTKFPEMEDLIILGGELDQLDIEKLHVFLNSKVWF
jgi:hypothetical protein